MNLPTLLGGDGPFGGCSSWWTISTIIFVDYVALVSPIHSLRKLPAESISETILYSNIQTEEEVVTCTYTLLQP